MKAGTENSIKFKRLQRRLKLKVWQCRGVLESLWAITAKDAPQGNIGRLSNEDIAVVMDWDDDENELIAALIDCGWLDEDDEHRLLVHNWHKHCPTYIRGQLARHGRAFFTGEPDDSPKDVPKETPVEVPKDVPKETPVEPAKDAPLHAPTKSSQVKPSQAQSNQAKPSEAQPNQIKNPAQGFESAESPGAGSGKSSDSVFERLQTEDLRHVDRVYAWLQWQAKQTNTKPVFPLDELKASGDKILLNTVSAAVRSCSIGDKPVRMFAAIVGRRDWSKISSADEDKAQRKIRVFRQNQRMRQPA